jgi:hypothetical protein
LGQVAVLEQQVCSVLEQQTEVTVEWAGKADRDVPRQLSARTTPDLNKNNTPVRLPLREISKGENVRHGIYVVERIELAEKDGVIIASETPKDRGLVVSVVCTIAFNLRLFASSLGHFGIGDGTQLRAPYIDPIIEAIVKVVTGYYAGIGVRFAHTRSMANSIGIEVEIRDEMMALDVFPGGHQIQEAGTGFAITQNIFGWCEESFGVMLAPGGKFRCAVGPSSMLNRNLDQGSDDSKAMNEVFGPLGVPRDSVLDPPTLPKLPKPRTVAGGRVDGQVTALDDANTSVVVNDAGVITVTSTNPTVVPAQRATDIQRALNAFTNAVGTIAAHEFGHCLGLVSEAVASRASITVAGKGTFLSPLNGVDSHNRTSQGDELLDRGDTIRFRRIFTPGERLAFRDTNRRYLLDCFPESPPGP